MPEIDEQLKKSILKRAAEFLIHDFFWFCQSISSRLFSMGLIRSFKMQYGEMTVILFGLAFIAPERVLTKESSINAHEGRVSNLSATVCTRMVVADQNATDEAMYF